MPEFLLPYRVAIVCLGFYGGLSLVQLLVTDLNGILRKHTPGMPVDGGHDDLLFRTSRVFANTSESIGAVILISGFTIAMGVDPDWLGRALGVFLVSRVLHMFAYYFDFRFARMGCFALGIVTLLSIFGQGLRTLM